MKKLFTILFLLFVISAFGQRDSLRLGEKYADDQLYIGLTYNQFFNQPAQIGGTGFSYGFFGGFIKDIPVTGKGNISVGIGVGYGFDTFNHGLKVSETNTGFDFSVDNTITANKLSIHTIEFPLELRWRTSTAKKYKFWRIYTGIKIGYNLSNTFTYKSGSNTFKFNNIPNFRSWQYGITTSIGYDAFNAHVYYGLTSIFENAFIQNAPINTKILKIGLMFYIL